MLWNALPLLIKQHNKNIDNETCLPYLFIKFQFNEIYHFWQFWKLEEVFKLYRKHKLVNVFFLIVNVKNECKKKTALNALSILKLSK